MINKNKIISELKGIVLTIILTIFISALISTTAFAKVRVEQISMENTLHDMDQLLINKLSYKFSNPKRGDIIIFFAHKEKNSFYDCVSIFIDDVKSIFSEEDINTRYVKRIIGIPGDIVNIKDGYVYVNNEKIDEPYVKGLTESKYISLPITVEENKLFVLGDNRANSTDSRDFGVVDFKQLDGKAMIRLYPFDEIGNLD